MSTDPAALPLERKAALLSGQDFWSTEPVAEIPSVVLTDGPHGVRRQAGDFDTIGAVRSPPARASRRSSTPGAAGRRATTPS